MADAVYDHTKKLLIDGELDLSTGGSDIRALLTKTMTSATTTQTTVAAVVSSGTNEVYTSGSNGYTRETLDNDDTVQSTSTSYADDTVNLAFGSLDAGVTITGCLIYKHVTDDSDSLPLVWLDFAPGTATNGQAVSVQLAAEGWLKLV